MTFLNIKIFRLSTGGIKCILMDFYSGFFICFFLEMNAFPFLLFIIGDLEILFIMILLLKLYALGEKGNVSFLMYKANLNLNGGIAINSVIIRK